MQTVSRFCQKACLGARPIVCVDLSKLKMWDPLQKLLTSPISTEDIKVQTMWVIGTAVQNNPAAQNTVRILAILPQQSILNSLIGHDVSISL